MVPVALTITANTFAITLSLLRKFILIVKFILDYYVLGSGRLAFPDLNNRSKRFTPTIYIVYISVIFSSCVADG
jgi:hypothetical protein